MIDVKIFNVTVLMTNCCLLTDRKTGKMAEYSSYHSGGSYVGMSAVLYAEGWWKLYIHDGTFPCAVGQ